MLVPIKWLSEYVNVKVEPRILADMISLSSIGVKEVTKDYLNLEVTYNRGDLLSILGVAREVSVLTKEPLLRQMTKNSDFEWKRKSVGKLSVAVDSFELCPFYSLVKIEGVAGGDSPDWMKERLIQAGMRPLNLLIDITNYVMLEYGQPLHAFDGAKVHQEKVIVRQAKKNEQIRTLDGKLRKLKEDTLLITDPKGPIAIAGVMGGEDSEVSYNTKTILLEAAIFNQTSIRVTSKKLGLVSEASNRFVHGLSRENLYQALNRAVNLYVEFGGGRVTGYCETGKNEKREKTILLKSEKVEQLLGVSVPIAVSQKILERLGFSVKIKNAGKYYELLVTPPYFRLDIEEAADVVEEIARIYGYEKLPGELPTGYVPAQVENKFEWVEKKVKETLRGLGFCETYSYSFGNKELYEMFESSSSFVKVANPMSFETEYMRPTLIAYMLLTIKKNLPYETHGCYFELGKVYKKRRNDLPLEPHMLTLGITKPGNGEDIFFMVKKDVELILSDLGVENVTFRAVSEPSFYHPGRCAQIIVQKKVLGQVGEINPKILPKFQLEQRVIVADIDFDLLTNLANRVKSYNPIPKYPSLIEDISVVGDRKILTGNIIETTLKQSHLITEVKLVDTYKDSRTFRITYQGKDRTLSDKEIEVTREKVINILEKGLRLKVRRLES